MNRKYFKSNGFQLSYIESGQQSGDKILCLHGMFGCARYFSNVMESLDTYHVYSLDQRGHGWSHHAERGHYGRDDFNNDITAFIKNEMVTDKVILLGHSMGGISAIEIACKYPEFVKAVIIEDAGAIENDDASFAPEIVNRASSLKGLAESLQSFGIKDARYFIESAVETKSGWEFRFDKQNIPEMQRKLNGDRWDEFLNIKCPVLLLHGANSWVVETAHMQEMCRRRPETNLITIENSGHAVNMDEPVAYVKAVKDFLSSI